MYYPLLKPQENYFRVGKKLDQLPIFIPSKPEIVELVRAVCIYNDNEGLVQRSPLTSIPTTGPSFPITIIFEFTVPPSFIIQYAASILPSENPSCPFLLLYRHILALTDISIASLPPHATCIWQWHQHSSGHLKMKYWTIVLMFSFLSTHHLHISYGAK